MKKPAALVSAAALVLVAAAWISPQQASSEEDPVLATVGDIACNPLSSSYKDGLGTATSCRHKYVADLIRSQAPDKFLALGDIQYESGELVNFQTSYDAAFGDLMPITLPVVGNHEYRTAGASGYATYFNESAPFWYSTDIGTWHVIVLDSNCGKIGGCGPKTPQGLWLKEDLAANPAQCTIAAWHHPRYNSGEHGGAKNMTFPMRWLYKNNAEVVLNGHEHSYQRFQPINPYTHTVDQTKGLTEFVVGSGGKSHYAGGSTNPLSAYRNTTDYGAAFFTLHDGSYSYEFRSESGEVLDSGSKECH